MHPFGQELRRIRKELGYNLEEASKLIGITRPYLSMIERDRRIAVTFKNIIAISEAYQIPLDYLKRIHLENGPINTTEEILEWNKISNRVNDGYKYAAYNRKMDKEKQGQQEEEQELIDEQEKNYNNR